MQKLLLASTMVLAASVTVAKAQNTNAPETAPQTTQPPERGGMMRGMMGGGMPGREPGAPPTMMMAHMMANTTGAIFHVRRGDTSIFIKCAENESTQACVTAAGTLLDKFNQPAH